VFHTCDVETVDRLRSGCVAFKTQDVAGVTLHQYGSHACTNASLVYNGSMNGRGRNVFLPLISRSERHAARRGCVHAMPACTLRLPLTLSTHPETPGAGTSMSGGELGLLVLPTCKSLSMPSNMKHLTCLRMMYLVVQYSRLRLSLCLLPLCLLPAKLPAPMPMPSHISCRCISLYSTPASASRCACCRCACSPRRCPCHHTSPAVVSRCTVQFIVQY